MLGGLWRWIPFGRVPEIDARSLEALVRADAVQVVDVRTRSEFRRGHIAGARHLPIQEFARLDSLRLDRRKPVVAICKTAHRSIPAVRLLRAAGYDASQLAGGMNAWRRSGLAETVDPGEVG